MEDKRKENEKDYGRITKKLFEYIFREWKLFLITIIIVIISNIIVLYGPRLSGRAIDTLSNSPINLNETLRFILLMLGSYVGSSVLTYIASILMTKTSQKIIVKMRQDTFDKIVDLPISYIDTHQAGDLVSRISYDLDVVNQNISNNIVSIISSVMTVIGSFIMMMSISIRLSLIFVILIPVTVLYTRHRIKKTRPLFSYRSKKLGEMNGYVEEILNGQETIQAYEKEQYFSDEFGNINTESIDAYYKADYESSVNFPTMEFITNFTIGLVSMLGAILYLNDSFTLGFLSAFVLYSRQFSFPINQIAGTVAEIQSVYSAANRVFKLLEQDNEKKDSKDAVELKNIKGKVEFRNLDFGYEKDKLIIKDFNYIAKPGSITAIVGHTGAGKTTLINLLMRFYEPNSGDILIDDISYKEIKRVSQRNAFAMVLQDTWLFKGTIRENISYARPEASLAEVKKVAKAAHIDSFIEMQENGYDTVLEEEASNISQGQKQLITIARAMLLDSSMLILDEATSNVDSRTEIKIQDAMNKLMLGKTAFVIAHRLSTIKNADNILLLDKGEVVESGTHEELLKKNGRYAELYNSQFIEIE